MIEMREFLGLDGLCLLAFELVFVGLGDRVDALQKLFEVLEGHGLPQVLEEGVTLDDLIPDVETDLVKVSRALVARPAVLVLAIGEKLVHGERELLERLVLLCDERGVFEVSPSHELALYLTANLACLLGDLEGCLVIDGGIPLLLVMRHGESPLDSAPACALSRLDEFGEFRTCGLVEFAEVIIISEATEDAVPNQALLKCGCQITLCTGVGAAGIMVVVLEDPLVVDAIKFLQVLEACEGVWHVGLVEEVLVLHRPQRIEERAIAVLTNLVEIGILKLNALLLLLLIGIKATGSSPWWLLDGHGCRWQSWKGVVTGWIRHEALGTITNENVALQ